MKTDLNATSLHNIMLEWVTQNGPVLMKAIFDHARLDADVQRKIDPPNVSMFLIDVSGSMPMDAKHKPTGKLPGRKTAAMIPFFLQIEVDIHGRVFDCYINVDFHGGGKARTEMHFETTTDIAEVGQKIGLWIAKLEPVCPPA